MKAVLLEGLKMTGFLSPAPPTQLSPYLLKFMGPGLTLFSIFNIFKVEILVKVQRLS